MSYARLAGGAVRHRQRTIAATSRASHITVIDRAMRILRPAIRDGSGDEVFGNRVCVTPIGVKYTRIVNRYLFCGSFSPSEARAAAFRLKKGVAVSVL
jgi:hypothetical protein